METQLALFDAETRSSLENPSTLLSAPAAWLIDTIGGPRTDANEHVSETSALQVPTVLACTRILSEGVGSLPLRVYEELPGGGRREAKDHALHPLLSSSPNDDMTAVDLWCTVITHLVLWQVAYIEILRDGANRIAGLYPRVPWLTKPVRKNGILQFETTDTSNRQIRIVAAADMLHIVGFSLDGLTGTSLIAQARQIIGLSMAASRYSARFFANNARPGGILKLSGKMSPEDKTRMRQEFEALSSGSNTHRIGIIQEGVDWVEIGSSTARDSQQVEQQKLTKEEIASLMRVPGYMVGILDKTLKSTVEQQSQEFLNYSLRPIMVRIEMEVARKCLKSSRFTVAYHTNELLRADYAGRMTGYVAGRNAGVYSINDCRAFENLPPIAGGDDYLQMTNMVAVGNASTSVEEDDESGETDPDESASAAPNPVDELRSIFAGVWSDACGRLQRRSKRDSTAIRQTFSPLINAVTATLRSRNPVDGELKELSAATEKYLSSLEHRSKVWTPETDTTGELDKALRSIIFAVERDRADMRAKALLDD